MSSKVKEIKKIKKVAILGTVPHKLQAPFADKSFEIWAIAHACLGDPIPRCDKIFEIHKWDEIIKWKSDLAWKFFPEAEIYLREKRPELPQAKVYPFDDIAKKFNIFDDRKECLQTNSISWMIALAIDQGYKEIHVYGVNMSHNCITPETMVLMKDLNYKKAYEVNIGDEVIAFDENHTDSKNERKFRSAKVQKADYLTAPSYKLTFEDGTEITCSDNHRWLVHGGDKLHWLETEKLIPKGAYVDGRCSRILKPFEKWDTLDTYDAGYLAAAVDGEGHLGQATKRVSTGIYNSCTIGFAQRENEMLEDFIKCADKYNFTFNGGAGKEDCKKFQLTTRSEVVRFLGSVRPKRLLAKFNIDLLGRFTGKRVALVKKEYVGDKKVIAFKTTTGTFIAEGFASHNSEYGTQKPSCEYYLGLAKGMGIKIYIPTESDLCKSFFHYGLQEEEATELEKKIDDRIMWLQTQYNQVSNQSAFLMQVTNQLIGQIENTRQWMNKLKEKDSEKYAELIAEMEAKGMQLNQEFSTKQIEAQTAMNTVQQLVGGMEDSRYWKMTLKH